MSIENLLDPILMPPDLFNELGEAYEEAKGNNYNPLVRSINARDSKFFEDSIAILDRLWDDYSSSEILELVIARKLLEGHGRATEADIYNSMPAEYVRGVASSAATWDRIARRLGGRVSAGADAPSRILCSTPSAHGPVALTTTRAPRV